MPPRHLLVCSLAAILTTTSVAVAEPTTREWSQIRGPARDGRSPETGLLRTWPEDGPRLVWRRPIGEGFSSISASGGRLYTMAAYDGTEYALALDLETGEDLWRTPMGEIFTNQFGDGPRSTPTVDGDRLYVFSSRGRLAALSAEDGRPLWTVEVTEAFGSEVPRFGFSASVLVEGDLLVIETGGPEGKGLAALDKATGKTRWTALDGPAAYSSPVVAEFGGVRQIVFFRRAEPQIVSLLPDGEVYWTHAGLSAVIHMPLVVPPDGIYMSSTHDAEGFLLRVGTQDGKPFVEEAWRTTRMKNHFNTSVVVDGHIYGFDNAILKSLDAATGEQNWAHRGLGKGSLIEADGHLIVLSDSGVLALAEASPAGYVEKASFQATTGKAWTAPSLAGGRLYLRDQDEAASFDLTSASTMPEIRTASLKETARIDGAPVVANLGVAEVLERYAAARGGRERWATIETFRYEGTFTSFSIREPFTRIAKRPDLFRFETVMNGGRAVYGRDVAGPWWIDPIFGLTSARRPPEAHARQLDRRAAFEPPLLGAEEKGHRVELAGSGEVGGAATLKLEVTLKSGAKEIWHLHPETFLEVAVDAKILDVTQAAEPIDERAYFSDFREVAGVMIPHRVEREYLSRHTVLEIERLEVDPALEDERFALPLPEAMEALQTLAGKWELRVESGFRDRQPTQTFTTTATIAPFLDGALLEERFEYDDGSGLIRAVRQYTWDAAREVYRLTHVDDAAPYVAVFEGSFTDGRLTANASTGTEALERQVVYDVGPDGFKVDWERSTDAGGSWLTTTRYVYMRPAS